MYNALDEDFILQEMRDRAARLHRIPWDDNTRPNRRWWRRGVRFAR